MDPEWAQDESGDSEDLGAIARYADSELKPLAVDVDRNGLYPEAFLAGLGRLGGYGVRLEDGAAGPAGGEAEAETPGVDLAHQLRVIETIGRRCGATAFSVWCQSACAWYLARSANDRPRRKYLRAVAAGDVLAATGMSNMLKHLAGIERMRLRARRAGDGYVVDGVLPWISNLGDGHLLLTAAEVEEGGYAMFVLHAGAEGVRIKTSPEFLGMMGVGTYSVHLESAAVKAEDVLAYPDQFAAFIATIKPGMVLSQVGIGLGVMAGCLDALATAGETSTNAFVENDEEEIDGELDAMRAEAEELAREVQAGGAPLLPVLRLRARTSERVLRIAESTVLRCGARGYLATHPAQRRMREAIFVAIFTPALKQLRKEIHSLEQSQPEGESGELLHEFAGVAGSD